MATRSLSRIATDPNALSDMFNIRKDLFTRQTQIYLDELDLAVTAECPEVGSWDACSIGEI